MYSTLLFMDFDGTYWPRSSGNPKFFQEFSDFVLQYPEMAVVISSNWRFTHSLDDLRGYFHPAIEHRVIGTLDLEDDRNPGIRQQLIERYVREHLLRLSAQGVQGTIRFVALDDNATLFKPGWPHLILCEYSDGLTFQVLKAVHDCLEAQ